MRVQKKTLCLIIAVFVMMAAILIGSSISLAMANQQKKTPSGDTLMPYGSTKETVYKYYTSIRVERGDTLWSIADEYMTDEYDGREAYIAEVRKLNHLWCDRIYAGEYLTIPYYSTDLLR